MTRNIPHLHSSILNLPDLCVAIRTCLVGHGYKSSLSINIVIFSFHILSIPHFFMSHVGLGIIISYLVPILILGIRGQFLVVFSFFFRSEATSSPHYSCSPSSCSCSCSTQSPCHSITDEWLELVADRGDHLGLVDLWS